VLTFSSDLDVPAMQAFSMLSTEHGQSTKR
jgi:hypothetical protein